MRTVQNIIQESKELSRLVFATGLVILLIFSYYCTITVLLPASVNAATTPESCFNFDTNTGTITGYYDYQDNDTNNQACSRDVVIPDTLDSVAVTHIGGTAFRNRSLTSVVIPDSVLIISGGAFEANTTLTSVIIGSSVTTIGTGAFFRCGLTSVAIPNSVFTIGGSAFESNYLTSLSIPDSVTDIGEYAFFKNNISNLTLGNAVTNIPDATFGFNRLTSVNLPDSVTNVGLSAFVANSPYGRDGYDLFFSEDPQQVQLLYGAIRLVNIYTADPTNPNGLEDKVFTEADLEGGMDLNQNGNIGDILGSHLINPVDEVDQDTPLTTPASNNTTSYLVLPEGISNPVFSTTPDNQITPDPAFSYPAGLVSFQFDTTPGSTQTITLYFDLPGDPNDYIARKYNTTTNAYTTIDQATITRETYNNKDLLKLTYPITDGGLLDQDNQTNGTIVDPVGLATQTTNSPDTGLQPHWLLGVKG